MNRTAFLVLVLAAFMLFGCIGGAPAQNKTNQTAPTPPAAPVKTPIFSITAPTDQDVITASGNATDVELVLSSQNLVLKTPSGAAQKGQGYFRVIVDDLPAVVVTSKTYTMSGLGEGRHTVEVELYNNDNTPYIPAISKTVTFTIQAAAPTVYVPQSYTVTISGNSFSPQNLTINAGDSVTWINSGNVPQTATCSQGGVIVFDTKSIGPGKNVTLTFNNTLECEYYSQLFRALTGTISVQPTNVSN